MTINAEEILSLIETVGVSNDISTISFDASLTSAGVDSLEMMNILLAIEEQYDIKIPDEDINGLDTVNNIINYLNGIKA